jgi:hypothetical protein
MTAAFALCFAIPLAAAQGSDALDTADKLRFHVASAYSPMAILGLAACAGVAQAANAPEEWGHGGAAYGKRLASTAAWAGIHSTLAFGLDSALRQDPRYFRAVSDRPHYTSPLTVRFGSFRGSR